ncbi:MAG: DUF1214 domain-containing protein [Alphaproteobacteria bacterium]|nr:DUF1214 domain-containing protein [Alphaproteobacteria bacterium]
MRTALKVVAVVVIGVVLGLAATWAAVIRGGWGGAVSNGPWRTDLNTGSAAAGIYQRAGVAVHGLLALNRSETIYYTANRDSDGAMLDGACVYQVIGKDPPTRWWSVTAYAADDYLIPNPANRYSVSMNSVARRSDGTFTITVSKGGATENWIPVTDGRFSLSIRLYNPDASVAADPAHVALPSIRKVHCT